MLLAKNSRSKRMALLPLIAATYFMVAGGPYGIEDILGGAGFGWAIVILLLLPLFWSLPTALMIGELASAIPAEGGFYCLGASRTWPLLGLSGKLALADGGIFDVTLYPSISFFFSVGSAPPSLCRTPLCQFAGGRRPLLCMVLARRAQGRRRFRGLFALLLAPFVVFVVRILARHQRAPGHTLGPFCFWAGR